MSAFLFSDVSLQQHRSAFILHFLLEDVFPIYQTHSSADIKCIFYGS